MKHDTDAAPKSATGAMASDKPAREKHLPKLNDEQREYIVRRLAAYERPFRIRREVRERFGIELSRGAIEVYDPTRNAACGKKWADMFHTVRRAHVAEQSDQAIQSRKVERLVLRTVEILAERDAGAGRVRQRAEGRKDAVRRGIPAGDCDGLDARPGQPAAGRSL